MNWSLVCNYFDITGLKYDKRFTICLQGGKHEITEKQTYLLPNDMKFIVKAIWVNHQPILDTLYSMNKTVGCINSH